MRSAIAIAVLALGSSVQSIVLPRTSPCYVCQGFTITVSGGVSGPLGQISDGQNRVGPGTPNPAKYTLGCDGGIVDQNGRGCILTPPTGQYQCDTGAAPTTGFSIWGDGTIGYNGSSDFYACPVDDKGNWNIYNKPVTGQTKCTKVTLKANGCNQTPTPSPCPSSSTIPPVPLPSPQPSPQPPKPQPSHCPYENVYPEGQNFEFPHLIVPVDSSKPDTKYGTQYNGLITPKIATIFNFDVHPRHAGKKCSLVWLFPTNPPSDTSSYTFSGAGNLQFYGKSSPATVDTTWNNQPGNSVDYGVVHTAPGNSYTITTFDCPAGQRIAYSIGSSDTNLDFFQDYNPHAVGLYISVC